MCNIRKELTIDESVSNIDSILESHFATLPPDKEIEKRIAFHEYTSAICGEISETLLPELGEL